MPERINIHLDPSAETARSNNNKPKLRKDIKQLLGDSLKEVPVQEDQVGLALIDERGFAGMICLDDQERFKELVGEEIIPIDPNKKLEQEPLTIIFDYDLNDIPETVKKVLGSGCKIEDISTKDPAGDNIIITDLGEYQGEAVEHEKDTVYFLLKRK